MNEEVSILHRPEGLNDPYHMFEYERVPRQPMAGDFVLVRAKISPFAPGLNFSLNWTLNGIQQRPVTGQRVVDHHKHRDFVEFELGRFNENDLVSYSIEVLDGSKAARSPEFSFKTGKYGLVLEAKSITYENNAVRVRFGAADGEFQPQLSFAFEEGFLRISAFLKEEAMTGSEEHQFKLTDDGCHVYTDGRSGSSVEFQASPFRYRVKNSSGLVLFESSHGPIPHFDWNTGEQIRMGLGMRSSCKAYWGFGERFNALNQRGLKPDICVYNQYLDQNEETYIPIPFFMTDRGFGIYVDSARYLAFDLGAKQDDILKITGVVPKENPRLELKVFFGEPREVLRSFLEVTGMPKIPPKWAFGPWMSGNSWNTQKEVAEQVRNMNELEIPATVLVIEAWSDEASFYIINDAKYKTRPGSEVFRYNDFHFEENAKWPDFKGMVDFIHANGLRLILWQIPVLKHFEDPENEQHMRDEQYAIEKGYCVRNADGTPYRIPDGWFAGSLLLDFTNPEARQWWFSKRKYLVDDLDVDGFKTDGGEFVFDDNVVFWDGSRGDEMRNLYPIKYIEAYHAFQEGQGLTFSRAGFVGAQKYPMYWAGDQVSTWESLRRVMIAGLTMGVSGNPFWGFDIAGFSGEIPTAELFVRSTQMAAFCPVMQFHSESRGGENWDRSPWNIAARTKDDRALEIYRYYANLRMNLLPYIYREALHCSDAGEPLMRPIFFDYPDDRVARNLWDQYLFGRDLLVAPIVEEGYRQRTVYLPEGEWIDLWTGERHEGRQFVRSLCDLDRIPVFVKENAVIPLNLNEQFEFGGYVGNGVDEYQNLCFLILGGLNGIYEFADGDKNVIVEGQNGRLSVGSSNLSDKVFIIGKPGLLEQSAVGIKGQPHLVVYEL